jgi:hypothetical protein
MSELLEYCLEGHRIDDLGNCLCNEAIFDGWNENEWMDAQAEANTDDAFAQYGLDDTTYDAEGNAISKNRRGLLLYDLVGGFSEVVSTAKFIVKGMLDEASITNFIGLSNAGKSIFALELADQIAKGGVFLGQQLKPRPVLYLDQENKPQNLQRMKEEFGWEEFSSKNKRSKFIHASMFSELITGAHATELLIAKGKWQPDVDSPKAPRNELLVDWAKLHDPSPVVFIDTLARFFQGGDENSVQDFQHFWKQVNKLVEIGCAVVVLHHTTKNDGAKYRGSSDFLNKVDFQFAIENVSPDKTKHLTKFTIERLKQRSPDDEFSGKQTIKIVNGEFYFDDNRAAHPPILLELLRTSPACDQTEFLELVRDQELNPKISRDRILAFLGDSSLVNKVRGPLRNQWIHSLKDPE